MKSKITDLIFFLFLVLIVVHFSIGLDELGPFGWSVLAAMIGAWISPTPYNAGSASGVHRRKIGSLRLMSNYKLAAGTSVQILLDKRELASLGCQSLYAVDSSGREWPVLWQMNVNA